MQGSAPSFSLYFPTRTYQCHSCPPCIGSSCHESVLSAHRTNCQRAATECAYSYHPNTVDVRHPMRISNADTATERESEGVHKGEEEQKEGGNVEDRYRYMMMRSHGAAHYEVGEHTKLTVRRHEWKMENNTKSMEQNQKNQVTDGWTVCDHLSHRESGCGRGSIQVSTVKVQRAGFSQAQKGTPSSTNKRRI